MPTASTQLGGDVPSGSHPCPCSHASRKPGLGSGTPTESISTATLIAVPLSLAIVQHPLAGLATAVGGPDAAPVQAATIDAAHTIAPTLALPQTCHGPNTLLRRESISVPGDVAPL